MSDTPALKWIAMESVINRLALTSVILKAAALVFAAILISGCWINANNMHFHVAAAMLIVVWALDAYYLKLERGFRQTFANNLVKFSTVAADKIAPAHVKLRETMFSKTMVWYYVPLLVLTGAEFLLH